ncbi:MAG: leucyl/phenylalanyl-tRNA--protein transferase [Verrucomicrobia bacterium]|nr:leucyl/phenylalanyl-tRNA--protein transferase [Verrucomicrobiota bacterium]
MLTTDLLLTAYRHGLFPMAVNRRGTLGWFSPDPRALIPLDQRFHIPHGLRRTLKRTRFEIAFNGDFEGVIRACSGEHGDTWISPQIVRSYCRLHADGFAHSVETRLHGALVGGLYGVHVGGAFFGESMFHRVPDASKVALVALVQRLRERGFQLLDTQWTTPHLRQFGAFEIPRADYLRRLARAITLDCRFP